MKQANFEGFSKLSLEERMEALVEMGVLSQAECEYLVSGGLKSLKLGEKFIENVIGYFQLPLGVATHFRINGRDHVIPMAVEETSIVAAASKTAKWVKEHGEITTSVEGDQIIGQLQIARLQSRREEFAARVEQYRSAWVQELNEKVAFGMLRRGGGVSHIHCRFLDRPDGDSMAVLHVHMNPVDAMGANVINQVCEYLKNPVQKATGETVTMCILSNLVDTKLTRARVRLRNLEPQLMKRIEEASLFAELDPYRAATNNKGVLNGIDPILIATGNDWRAVEAGIHAYACRNGRYSSITRWWVENDELVGEFQAPLVVGTVGGVTSLHPTASLCLKILEVESASDLSQIIAAVGLVQNLGALRALTTVGIIEGHMKLHIKNLSLGAGAREEEIPHVVRRLEEILLSTKRISMSQAVEVLSELRKAEMPQLHS